MSIKPEKTANTSTATITSGPVDGKQTSSCAVGTEENSSLLLNGTYDEAASAASFQQALAEWRAGRNGESKKATVSTGANTHTTKGGF